MPERERPRPPRRVAVVFNPTSGQVPPARRERAIRAALDGAGVKVDWLETSRDRPCGALPEALADGVDLVCASGGDGTVTACASELAGTGVPLAILPGGTGNLLAANLGVPLRLRPALAVALAGDRRPIDLVRTETVHEGAEDAGEVTRRFAVMAGMGFDAVMLRGTDPRLKRAVGSLAYVTAGLAELRYPWDRYELVLDGGPPVVREASCVLVANTGRLRGNIPMVRGARPDDGLLDVAVIRARLLVDWAAVVARMAWRSRWGSVNVETFRARRVEITSGRPHPIEHDGDPEQHPVRRAVAEVEPGALTVCVPPVKTRPRR